MLPRTALRAPHLLAGCDRQTDLTRHRLANPGSLNDAPSRRVGEQSLQNVGVELVTAPDRAERAEHRVTSQRKIADGVEHLMAHELLIVAKSLAVHDLVIADGDGVGQVGAERQTGLPQFLNIAHEAERARAADFVAEDA